jgi:hypothetical protein
MSVDTQCRSPHDLTQIASDEAGAVQTPIKAHLDPAHRERQQTDVFDTHLDTIQERVEMQRDGC